MKRRRALILDLDLHQGDGNSAFFAADPEIFTLSIHERASFWLRSVSPRLPSQWRLRDRKPPRA